MSEGDPDEFEDDDLLAEDREEEEREVEVAAALLFDVHRRCPAAYAAQGSNPGLVDRWALEPRHPRT